MCITDLLRRELKVAFSVRAQPVWFRVTKYVVFLALGVALFPTRYFWHCVVGLLTLCIALHFFFRWKTRGWTQAYGMWDDVDAGR